MTDTHPSWPAPRLLPWHDPALRQLQLSWSSRHLPHAILLQGASGLGKHCFAAWLACAVLCERSQDQLQCCGACASCKLIAAGSHPDLGWVTPEEDKQQISVDQVRAVTERLNKTSFRHGHKIAAIEPAHQMTISAANSLLKTLEEPPADSLLILISAQPSALPATVRSRCQKLGISRPTPAMAMQWLEQERPGAGNPALLEFAGGAPLRALDYADDRFAQLDSGMQRSMTDLFNGRSDVTQVAAEWAKDALSDRLTWLDLWLGALARAVITGNAEQVTFPGVPVPLPTQSCTLNISGVYSLVDRARELKLLLTRTALQRELAVESWLIGLLQVLSPPGPARARE